MDDRTHLLKILHHLKLIAAWLLKPVRNALWACQVCDDDRANEETQREWTA